MWMRSILGRALVRLIQIRTVHARVLVHVGVRIIEARATANLKWIMLWM